jgi:DNA-binding GntR family transcriptional regulator
MNDFNIDRRSKIPYDKQLQLILRSMISRGILRKGAKLQDIDELAQELSIAPALVLKAYKLLEKERRVMNQNGIWLVSTGNIPKTVFDEFITIYESIQRNTQSTPSIKTLELDPKHKIKGELAKWLGSTTAIYTKRIYLGDEVPYMLVNAYLSDRLFSGFEKELTKDQPYFKSLHERYGITLKESDRQMNGVNLKKADAYQLGVPEGTAAYHTFVQHKDQNGMIYEVDEVFSISEIMHFTIEQDE